MVNKAEDQQIEILNERSVITALAFLNTEVTADRLLKYFVTSDDEHYKLVKQELKRILDKGVSKEFIGKKNDKYSLRWFESDAGKRKRKKKRRSRTSAKDSAAKTDSSEDDILIPSPTRLRASSGRGSRGSRGRGSSYRRGSAARREIIESDELGPNPSRRGGNLKYTASSRRESSESDVLGRSHKRKRSSNTSPDSSGPDILSISPNRKRLVFLIPSEQLGILTREEKTEEYAPISKNKKGDVVEADDDEEMEDEDDQGENLDRAFYEE